MSEVNKDTKKNLEEAIKDGSINKHMVNIVDNFSNRNQLSKSNYVEGVVDPGLKTIDSLMSKIYRKTQIELNRDISISDIKDIIRCSIIVDNYSQVIPLIRELRNTIPSLKGDVCENQTGYIGIHLSLVIDGVNAEMQISTRESWYAKQAGEEIYERWRLFSLPNEIDKINKMSDSERKVYLKNLFSQFNLRKIQFSYCKNMFASLHKYTKLDKYKEAINAVLYLNNYTQSSSEKDSLKRYTIKIKDIKSKDEFITDCLNYLSIAEIAKNDLITIANKALKLVKEKEGSYELTNDEKLFSELKKNYFSIITLKLKKDFNGAFSVSKYISKLNKITNELAFSTIYLNDGVIEKEDRIFKNPELLKLIKIVKRDNDSKNQFLSLIKQDNLDNML